MGAARNVNGSYPSALDRSLIHEAERLSLHNLRVWYEKMQGGVPMRRDEKSGELQEITTVLRKWDRLQKKFVKKRVKVYGLLRKVLRQEMERGILLAKREIGLRIRRQKVAKDFHLLDASWGVGMIKKKIEQRPGELGNFQYLVEAEGPNGDEKTGESTQLTESSVN